MRAARTMAATVLALVVFALVVELGGAGYYFVQNRRLVYLNDAATPAPAPEEDDYKQRLHPYFGIAGPYSATFHTNVGMRYTNSLGFFQREPLALPVVRKDKDFIVGIFGGSVAANMVLTPRGGVSIDEALRRLPALKDRRVVVINMAQGSGKEPQQLFELAYLLVLGQSLDLAIALDRFKELALGLESWRNALDPILPSGLIIGALAQEMMPAGTANADYYEVAYRVSAAKRDIERREADARAARTGTGYLVDRVLVTLDQMTLRKYLEQYNKAVNAAGDLNARRRMLGLDMPMDLAAPDKVRTLFELWMRSSRQMRILAEANGIGLIHIVQPNQYYAKKAFTETEKKIALSLPADHVYRAGVGEGYRMFEAQPHPGIVSALPLYDAEAGDIYVDNCCHVNARGETMLSEFVAARVADWLATKRN
jgi:hypothetical protein